ncbi:MAG: sugar phosphate isomerase/epimerase [Rhodospirillales bacterium]|nr:sugar phosphate isomerase/epimerase [Rhodospirillales bacterium]
MRLAVSNIGLPAFDHRAELARLPGLGFEGLEVAPSRVWQDTWQGLKPAEVAAYRRTVEGAGLRIIGLHSLFFDQPDLGLFKGAAARAKALDFLTHLSAVCRDLGGRTLIYGSAAARRRGSLAPDTAFAEAADFFAALARRIEAHGTCFCFEPLGPEESDFINSAFDSLRIVNAVSSPTLRLQLDAKALVQNNEATVATFRAAAPVLVHFHANDPGLGMLGATGQVDHRALASMLRDVGYDGSVSLEQRMLSADAPMRDIEKSALVLRDCYGAAGVSRLRRGAGTS